MSGERRHSVALLNASQKNSLSMTLSVLEEMLYEIEKNISCGAYCWIMHEMNDDLPAPVKKEIVRKIAVIRERIKVMMEEFDLRKRKRKASGDIMGKLSYAWEMLEGTKARYLRGYGAVAEGLTERLDPQLNAIIALMNEIQKLISMKEVAAEEDRNT